MPGGDKNLTLWLPAGQSAVEMCFENNNNLKGLFCGLVVECQLITNKPGIRYWFPDNVKIFNIRSME